MVFENGKSSPWFELADQGQYYADIETRSLIIDDSSEIRSIRMRINAGEEYGGIQFYDDSNMILEE